MTTTEVHASLRGILAAVVEACDRADVAYCLIGGGCLGIVRHNHSFVPWDDDLDLAVSARDWPRLLAALAALPPPYRLVSGKTAVSVTDSCTRANRDSAGNAGVCVDVVPMMSWRSLSWKRFEHVLSIIGRCQQAPYSPVRWKRYIQLLIRMSGLPRPVAFLARTAFDPMFVRHDRTCAERQTGIISGTIGARWVGKYPWDVVYPLRETDFEGIIVKVPNDLHQFLALRYGAEYMAIPALEKRWRHFDHAYRVTEE